MERIIIIKNTESGQELTLPWTPSSYPMGAGRTAERLDMAQTGQITLPGLSTLFSETLEFWLPAQKYPWLTSGAVTDPTYYIELLTQWSKNADVCRYIVTGTAVNAPVLLGTLEYGEQDGTNDVLCKLPIWEYRYLEEAQTEKYTQNSGRSEESASQPETADSYTVQSGDTLWGICKEFYGDGALAYQLATANDIKNPNLIYPGQVLTLPDAGVLAGYEATPAPSSSVARKKASSESTSSGGGGGSSASLRLDVHATIRAYAERICLP